MFTSVLFELFFSNCWAFSLDTSYPVCNFVPKLILYGAGALLTFIVDTNEVPASDLSSDNLGISYG